jgi:heat shock protein HslJ
LVCALLLLSGCAKPSKTADTAPVATSENLPGAATLVGTYAETNDGATFTHCATQARYPFAREGAFDALRRAVADAPHDSSQPLVVSLVGRLQPLPVVEGSPPRDQLIVDRVLRVWPDETCEKVGVETSLDNTYWKLVELNGKAVAIHEDQREVHLILRVDGHSVGGFGGCNPLKGRYERDGSKLRFAGPASTLMACPYIDDEQAFTTALERVTHYQILGESLDLRDDTGSLARFRAVYFR